MNQYPCRPREKPLTNRKLNSKEWYSFSSRKCSKDTQSNLSVWRKMCVPCKITSICRWTRNQKISRKCIFNICWRRKGFKNSFSSYIPSTRRRRRISSSCRMLLRRRWEIESSRNACMRRYYWTIAKVWGLRMRRQMGWAWHKPRWAAFLHRRWMFLSM